MRALATAALVLLAALAAGVETARACSCMQPDPRSLLTQADGAFVGRLESRRDTGDGRAVYTFRVERAVKGALGATVEVASASDGAACGLETPVGARIGLFLTRANGGWESSLCRQVDADDLLAAVRPLPAPDGRGPANLIVAGRFGAARLIALDARGRILAYGKGGGATASLTVCPGGARFAEGLHDETGPVVVIRETRTLRAVRRLRLPVPSALVLQQLRCVDRHGAVLAAFLSGIEPTQPRRARVVRVTPDGATTIWRGSAFVAGLTDRLAFVNAIGPSGRLTLTAVDLTTGTARAVVRLPAGTRELTSDRTGLRLAGLAYDTRGTAPARLVVVDLTRPAARVRSALLGSEIAPQQLFWLRDGRLAYAPYTEIRTYDRSLRLVARVPGWNAGATTVAGASAYGLGPRGTVVRATLPRGPVRVVRRLPSPTARLIAAVTP